MPSVVGELVRLPGVVDNVPDDVETLCEDARMIDGQLAGTSSARDAHLDSALLRAVAREIVAAPD